MATVTRTNPKRLTIPQVMYALKLKSYRKAYELVNSGQLGEIQMEGRIRTVGEAAVLEYARSHEKKS